jgi:hypothetical protein
MAATQDISATSTGVVQSSRRALNVVLIVCAVMTVVLAMVWAGAVGGTSGHTSRRSFTPYDSGDESVSGTYDSPYPASADRG